MKFCNTLYSRDKELLDRACGLALNSTCAFRHAAIVVKNGNILGWGFNYIVNDQSICSDPKTECSSHAEVSAVKNCRGANLSGASIYVARIATDGFTPMMSKPCHMCQEFLSKRGIKKVYYTVDSYMEVS